MMTADELVGKPVKVYYNLHKQCLSVQYKNKVVAHLDAVTLKDVKFKVSEAGRQRVLKTGNKNVHAKVCGIFEGSWEFSREIVARYGLRVTYNPYKYDSFVTVADNKPITEANRVVIGGKYIGVIP